MHPNMRNFTAQYVFHEYPKWVKSRDGSDVIVHDAAEEAAVTSESIDTSSSGDRDDLLARARELGLSPHPRTGAEKLAAMIAEAEKGA